MKLSKSTWEITNKQRIYNHQPWNKITATYFLEKKFDKFKLRLKSPLSVYIYRCNHHEFDNSKT